MSLTYVAPTYMECLETLVRECADDVITVSAIKEAMTKDQHRLFHDAEFVDGCTICDTEWTDTYGKPKT